MSSMVALNKILIPNNVRTVEGVTDLHGAPLSEFPIDERAEILALAENIAQYGLLQPIVVKDLGKESGFRLVAGFRRFKAVQHLGKKSIDAKSVKGKKEDEIILQLIENVHRKDLNPMEISRGLDDIRRIKGIKTQQNLAKVVGKSQAWVSQYLGLLKTDKSVQEAVDAGEMTMQAARDISSLPREEQAPVVEKAKQEAKEAGKTKVTAKGAKRQVSKVKDEKDGKQQVIRPLKEREQEQKTAWIKGFIDSRYGDFPVPDDVLDIVNDFWDFLMKNSRLYIDR